MKTVVADASFCGAWLLPDEATEAAEALLRSLEAGRAELVLPALWPYEMMNLLRSAHRRGRLTKRSVANAREALDAVPVAKFDLPDPVARKRVLQLAFAHGLSAYDAAYLELACRLKAPLRTNDRNLARAARAERLPEADR